MPRGILQGAGQLLLRRRRARASRAAAGMATTSGWRSSACSVVSMTSRVSPTVGGGAAAGADVISAMPSGSGVSSRKRWRCGGACRAGRPAPPSVRQRARRCGRRAPLSPSVWRPRRTARRLSASAASCFFFSISEARLRQARSPAWEQMALSMRMSSTDALAGPHLVRTQSACGSDPRWAQGLDAGPEGVLRWWAPSHGGRRPAPRDEGAHGPRGSCRRAAAPWPRCRGSCWRRGCATWPRRCRWRRSL